MFKEMKVEPVVLEGRRVRLEPLESAHLTGLADAALDPASWRWIAPPVKTSKEMVAYIESALDEQERGISLPFVLIEKGQERVIGSTRYGNIDHKRGRLEIGWTWVEREWERVVVATEAKYLLLRHAFEELGCIRVGLRSSTLTDWVNMLTREAILSASTFDEECSEGPTIPTNSIMRHDVLFTIVDSAWPSAKARIERMLRLRDLLDSRA